MIASISRMTAESVGKNVCLQRHTFSPFPFAVKAAPELKYTRADMAVRGRTETPEQKNLRALNSSSSMVSLVSCLRW